MTQHTHRLFHNSTSETVMSRCDRVATRYIQTECFFLQFSFAQLLCTGISLCSEWIALLSYGLIYAVLFITETLEHKIDVAGAGSGWMSVAVFDETLCENVLLSLDSISDIMFLPLLYFTEWDENSKFQTYAAMEPLSKNLHHERPPLFLTSHFVKMLFFSVMIPSVIEDPFFSVMKYIPFPPEDERYSYFSQCKFPVLEHMALRPTDIRKRSRPSQAAARGIKDCIADITTSVLFLLLRRRRRHSPMALSSSPLWLWPTSTFQRPIVYTVDVLSCIKNEIEKFSCSSTCELV